jgi:hypothetical protein
VNPTISLLLGVVIGAGLFLIGIRFFPQLARERQNYPYEEQIEAALLPHLFNAIASAYRLSEQAMDDLQTRIRGSDKSEIANRVYELLPDRIGNFDITAIKSRVGPERFSELIQQSFEQFDQFYTQHHARFDDLYEAWKRENAPS